MSISLRNNVSTHACKKNVSCPCDLDAQPSAPVGSRMSRIRSVPPYFWVGVGVGVVEVAGAEVAGVVVAGVEAGGVVVSLLVQLPNIRLLTIKTASRMNTSFFIMNFDL